MRKTLKIITFSIAATLLSCSSVLEDRVDCACALTLMVSGVPEAIRQEGILVSIVDEEDADIRQSIFRSSDYPDKKEIVIGVPKRRMNVSAVNLPPHGVLSPSHDALTMKEECEMDSIWLHSNYVNCNFEQAADIVRLHKQWCTITLDITGLPEDMTRNCMIEGNWNGTMLHDYSPSPGYHSANLRHIGSNRFQVRVPRQGDDKLVLKFHSVNPSGEKDGPVHEFPIGFLIRRSGYDWSRKSLDDIHVALDYAAGQIDVEVRQWDCGYDFGDIDF